MKKKLLKFFVELKKKLVNRKFNFSSFSSRSNASKKKYNK